MRENQERFKHLQTMWDAVLPSLLLHLQSRHTWDVATLGGFVLYFEMMKWAVRGAAGVARRSTTRRHSGPGRWVASGLPVRFRYERVTYHVDNRFICNII